MPFSHHSHSGQFCSHAVDTLEEVVQAAISAGMHTWAMTEHIPRGDQDLYPEEASHPHCVLGLHRLFSQYYAEATRLREKYSGQISLLVGFETEWIRPESLTIIHELLKLYRFDLFVGSVHHVHSIPIDYDDATYRQARDISGGTDELLYQSYFDSQLDMLKALKPPVVGHFDLIRLKSDDPNRNWTSMPTVWQKIVRNLELVQSFGGIIELNTSALRKGLKEPYPKAEICQAFMRMGGRFTLSDDSHGVDHVGTNYGRALDFIRSTGIAEICYLEPCADKGDARLDMTVTKTVAVAEMGSHKLWKSSA